jgi:hypothetical protein
LYIVVLDTSAIYNNWFLKGSNITLLEKHVERGYVKFVFPEIVILEIKNLFKEEVHRQIKSIDRLNKLITKENAKIQIPDTEKLCQDYEIDLDNRLSDLHAEIITYSDISHEKIVFRALNRRKPFSGSGRGYRDTLIWETILNKIANDNDTVIFVTNNHNDFGSEEKNRLHSHLIEDLISENRSPDSIILYNNLRAFVEERILPNLQVIENLQGERYIREWFSNNREELINALNNKIDTILGNYPELEEPKITYIEDPDDIIIDRVDTYSLDKNITYIDTIIQADVLVDVFIWKSDYYGVEEKLEINIIESDWNKHYMFAQVVLNLPIEISFIFNVNNEDMEEFEVNLGEIFGFCHLCNAPILSDAAETCYKCGKRLF